MTELFKSIWKIGSTIFIIVGLGFMIRDIRLMYKDIRTYYKGRTPMKHDNNWNY